MRLLLGKQRCRATQATKSDRMRYNAGLHVRVACGPNMHTFITPSRPCMVELVDIDRRMSFWLE